MPLPTTQKEPFGLCAMPARLPFVSPSLVRIAHFVSSLCLIVSISLPASAGPYGEDLGYFKRAVEFSGGTSKAFNRFRNPLVGPRKFRLPEANAPWAGNYFPMSYGGLAYRWQSHGSTALDHVDAKIAPKSLSSAAVSKLSPIEKYDLFVGNYDFRATRFELERRGPLRDPKPEIWEGFCNGARCAGALLPEPVRSIEVTNPEGVKVTFEPADLKALAAASYFYVENYAQLGAPTTGANVNRPNPAVFDFALRYYLGVMKKPFVIDAHLGSEIWNESVVGFERKLSEAIPVSETEKAAYPGATRKIQVDLTLETLGEIDIRSSNGSNTKLMVAEDKILDQIRTQYELFIDENGRAVDGKWLATQKMRGIDFVWFSGGKGTDAQQASGNRHLDFQKVQELVTRASTKACSSLFQ